MGEKSHKKIYNVLLEGATAGLSDNMLYDFVKLHVPKATSKKIVHASLFALTDPDVRDANVLHVIYALAIKHRMDASEPDDVSGDEGND